MLKAEDNEILTRVGPGTLMGELLRRYWTPACLTAEIPEPGGAPARVRLLGENLVAFRDTTRAGRAGAGELPAPRRVAVLRPQRGRRPALRLPRLGVRRRRPVRGHAQRAGAVLREGPDARLPHARVRRHRLDLPGAAGDDDAVQGLRHRRAGRRRVHRDQAALRPATGCRRWKATSTPRTSPTCTSGTGSTTSPTTAPTSPATRPTPCPGSSGGTTAPRASNSTTPGTGTATPASAPPPTATPTSASPPTRCRTTTMVAQHPVQRRARGCSSRSTTRTAGATSSRRRSGRTPANSAARTSSRSPRSRRRYPRYSDGIIPRRYTAENDYQIDREVQRTGIFSGVADFVSQDLMVTESMGPIYDRTQEQLGSTDKAISRMRHLLISAAKGLAEGKEPPAVGAGLDFRPSAAPRRSSSPARTGACSAPATTRSSRKPSAPSPARPT